MDPNPQGFQYSESFRVHLIKLLQIKQFILKNKIIQDFMLMLRIDSLNIIGSSHSYTDLPQRW